MNEKINQKKRSNIKRFILTGAGVLTGLSLFSTKDVFGTASVNIGGNGGGGTPISFPITVPQGGTNLTSLTANKLLVGNGTSAVLVPNELHWNNTDKRLGISNTSPNYQITLTDSGVGIQRSNTNELSFYTNNTQRMYIASNGIVHTLGNINIPTGASITQNSQLLIRQDGNSILIGQNSGASASYDRAVGVGVDSLRFNNANRVVGMGYESLRNNTGFRAVGVGYETGGFNEGEDIVANGYRALYQNVGQNAIGYGALAGFQNEGDHCFFVGLNSGYQNKGVESIGFLRDSARENTGSDLIAVGREAGRNNSGNNCKFLGRDAGKDNIINNMFIIAERNISSTHRFIVSDSVQRLCLYKDDLTYSFHIAHNGTVAPTIHLTNAISGFGLTNGCVIQKDAFGNHLNYITYNDNTEHRFYQGGFSNPLLRINNQGRMWINPHGSNTLKTQLEINQSPNQTINASGLIVGYPTLGTTAGNHTDIAEFRSDTGNNLRLLIQNRRVTNGTTWTTASFKIQPAVDNSWTREASNRGYVEFFPNNSTGRLVLSGQNSAHLSIMSTGQVSIGNQTTSSGSLLYVSSGDIRGSYRSADNSIGVTNDIFFFDQDSQLHSVSIKNGIITGWNVS